jgi:hypothetical protein
MRVLLALLAVLATGCTSAYLDRAYWDRPGATLPELADEADACYKAALAVEPTTALAVTRSGPPLLPRTEPPPKLWALPPDKAALERVDEQLRYERCMRTRGWRVARTTSPRP